MVEHWWRGRTAGNMVHRDKQCSAFARTKTAPQFQLVTPEVFSAMLLLFGSVHECKTCDPSHVKTWTRPSKPPVGPHPRMDCPGCGKHIAIEYQRGDMVRLYSHLLPTGGDCPGVLHPDDVRLREWYELEALMES